MVEAPFPPSAGCWEDAGICRRSPREEPDERRQLIQDKLITACLQFSVAHNENSSAARREAVIILTNNLHPGRGDDDTRERGAVLTRPRV